jgi:hypothetical protein
MSDYKYYEAEEHGPMADVPLDRRYCLLRGGYLLCPGLDDERKSDALECDWWCKVFREELQIGGKTSVSGLSGTRTPIPVAMRCEECLRSTSRINLLFVQSGQKLDPQEKIEKEIREEIEKK